MGGAVSFALVAGALAAVFWVLQRQKSARQEEYGPAGTSEFRTALPLDECMDRLSSPGAEDVFAYTCPRRPDGSFDLRFTMHQATRQPVGTRYSLRLDPGRETVVTLIFLGEAFGYGEPVFGPELLDEFMQKKLNARRVR